MNDQILNAKEAAALLRISLDSLYAGANRGDIPHKRIGRRMVFSHRALSAWLASGGQEQTRLSKTLGRDTCAANDEFWDADTEPYPLKTAG